MKRSSKIISLALSVTMAASCFAGFSISSASAADEETKVYFKAPDDGSWGTTKSVYCHIDNVYGDSPITPLAWQVKGELCKKDADTGLYYYDTTKVGEIKEGSDYLIIFSTINTDKVTHQTCDMTFGANCLGDTMYVTGEEIENPVDSSKVSIGAAWENNSESYGPKAVITSTGKVSGSYFPFYQPKEQVVSNFLHDYAVKNAEVITPEIVQADCEQLGVEPAAVLEQYKADFAEQLADPENNPTVASVEAVAALLGVDPNPTTAPATTEPATTEPATTEPATTEPATTAPATTEPATTEPATTEPATTEPATTEPAPVLKYGDLDQDGIISIQDATEIQKLGLGVVSDDITEEEIMLLATLADVNDDGRVSILDVTYVQKYLVGGYSNTGLVGTVVEAVG